MYSWASITYCIRRGLYLIIDDKAGLKSKHNNIDIAKNVLYINIQKQISNLSTTLVTVNDSLNTENNLYTDQFVVISRQIHTRKKEYVI